MKEKEVIEELVIKDFGPIKSVELELSRFNVLIGEQGTGKSTIVKLLAVCRYFSYIVPTLFDENRTFSDGLQHWGLLEFVTDNSSIFYKCESYSFEATRKKKEIKSTNSDSEIVLEATQWELNLKPLSDGFKQLLDELQKIKSSIKAIGIPHSFYTNNVSAIMKNPLYFPTERGLQSVFSLGGSPDFSYFLYSYFAKIDGFYRSFSGETKIEPLNITYKFEQGRGYIKKEENDSFLILRNGASGYQSTVPIVLAIKNYNKNKKSKTFIVEEPELNLFPKTQHELVKFLVDESNSYQHQFILTTHSPYVLTSLNNLMAAYQAGQINKEKTSKIIEEKFWLNPEHIAAYIILPDVTCENLDRNSEDIMDREEGMIKAEKIDGISSVINNQFSELLNIELGIE